MRTILFILQKEFLQIFRNRAMLPIIFVMPFVQLIILSNAATFDMKNVELHVIDLDQSAASRRLVAEYTASGYFRIAGVSHNEEEGLVRLARGTAHGFLRIPRGFSSGLATTGAAKVQLVVDAVDGFAAGLIQSYTADIVSSYSGRIALETAGLQEGAAQTIDVSSAYWYNPELDYRTFMVPGILVLLVTLIGFFLSGMNIVREKELGTIEQLNITPIHKYQFIAGKLLPFLLIGLAELALGLATGRILYNTPMLGSLPLVFCVAGVYMLAVLGLGLLISTVTDTQQQAMFISWFFMVIFILMSGLFTPIESMPGWAQTLTLFNPIAYFIAIIRQVLLKGAGFADIQQQFWSLCAFAAVMLALAVLRYRKTV